MVYLTNNLIGDVAMDRILQWIIDSPSVNTLRSLVIAESALTKIPRQFSSFSALERIVLWRDPLNTTIRYGSLNFSYPVSVLCLESCGIKFIEPGAFQGLLYKIIFNLSHKIGMFIVYIISLGEFRNSFIFLRNNSLTRFESSVFYNILNEMYLDKCTQCGLDVSLSRHLNFI